MFGDIAQRRHAAQRGRTATSATSIFGLERSGTLGRRMSERSRAGTAADRRPSAQRRRFATRGGAHRRKTASLDARASRATIGARRRSGRAPAVMRLESFSVGADYPPHAGRLQRDRFQHDGCPARTAARSRGRSRPAATRALSGAFPQAIAAPIAPLRVELSARVDQWNNNDGHSVDSRRRRHANTTYADRSKTAFSPRLGARYQLLSDFSIPRRRVQGVPRAEPRRAVSQADERRRRSPFRIPTSSAETRWAAKSASMAAARLAADEGHVLRRRLQRLQRADDADDERAGRVRHGRDLPPAS